MRIVAALVASCVMVLVFVLAPRVPADSPSEPSPDFWIKIVFGLDEQPAVWDGRLLCRGGQVLGVAEWGLEARDQLDADNLTWKIRTGIPDARRVSFAEPLRGLLVKLAATPETNLMIETEQGSFELRPEELKPGRPSRFLNHRATVERLGTAELVADTTSDDDFAAICVDRHGARHVAWIAYDDDLGHDRLLIRNVDDTAAEAEEIAQGREFADPHIFTMPDGTIRAVWCAPGEDRNWDIHSAVRESAGWRAERLTTAEGTDFHLAADLGREGTLCLAWQSFRDGQADIYAMSLDEGRWSDEIPVAVDPADEWEPAVSVDRQGNAWIGYDTYAHGNYDVYVVRVNGHSLEVGDPIAVATSPHFEAHASVLAEDDGKVWVAYDAAGPNWGKDFRNVPTFDDGRYSEPLHASRRLELRLVDGDRVLRPIVPLPQVLPPERIHAIERKPTAKPSRFYEYPQLARDGANRIWLLFRMCRQGFCGHPPKGACWRIYATTHTEGGWLEPIQLPRSWGRQNQRVACASDGPGTLQCAWADGDRFASMNRKYVVYCGALPDVTENVTDIDCEEIATESPGSPEPTPASAWTIKRGQQTYQLYYGDLHRHTNISRCSPTIDGSLDDAHRYALNAVGLDFLAITDHTRDVDPFSWWRTQKAADQYHIPGRYVPIYAYERSNNTPGGGHRNVFFLERGHEVNPSDHWYLGRDLPRQDADPDTTLYPWMRQTGGALTAAHTPVYSKRDDRGTWTFHDPQLEPVAEIFQGFRQSYERPGRGVVEEASLWFALRKGYRLGFIASSDHISTHFSYACVWAEQKTREAIFEGLSARRTFAATDRIVLDFRIGEVLMGEESTHSGKDVTLAIRALGTVPVRDIEIVRSGEVIATLHPGVASVDLQHVDREPQSGTSYYYVRLVQDDGAIAWGSPIWVTR